MYKYVAWEEDLVSMVVLLAYKQVVKISACKEQCVHSFKEEKIVQNSIPWLEAKTVNFCLHSN